MTDEQRIAVLNALIDEQFAAFVALLEQVEAEVAAKASA